MLSTTAVLPLDRIRAIIVPIKELMSNENPKIEVRDLRDGDWLWTHKAVLFSPYISASDFKVYCGLSSYAGNQDQRSWPSMITLAARLNLSRPTVIRSLKLLEACGLIAVERQTGMSNIYSLLRCHEIRQPAAPSKEKSPHHRLVNFFHVTTQKFRGFKPVWAPKDVARLKNVLALNVMSETHMEQLMLYFLASPAFKAFSPSMATFFSPGIFNGLMNKMQNDRNFWKELDGYSSQLGQGIQPTAAPVPLAKVLELTRILTEKMTIKKDPQ